MTETSWGVELWDCFEKVLQEVTINNGLLSGTCSRYIRERGEVEKEYAKSLRRLSAKYGGQEVETREERGTEKAFRAVMAELGYQAGQHELLAEQYQKNFPQEIKQAIKDAQKIVDTLKKDLKSYQVNLEKSYKNLDKSQLKYVKLQEDLTSTKDSLSSKPELEDEMRRKEQQTEEQRVEYAVQLVKTNKCRAQYYDCDLPTVLGRVEKLCESQYQYFISVMTRCVASEQSVMPIISKCQEDMRLTLEQVEVGAELTAVVERYKTGGVPPGEIQFEDLSLDPGQMRGVLTLGQPIQLSIQAESGVFLYQEKRTLQKKIKEQEEQIEKGEREIQALTKMVNTYKANPKFGCPDKLCEQLEMSVQRVEILRSGVQLLQGELERILSRLEIIKMSNETYYYTSNYSDYSLSRKASEFGSSDISKEYESIEEIKTKKPSINFYGECDGDGDQKVYQWVRSCSKSPSPPPPPIPAQPPVQLLARVVALYPFVGEVENSLTMEEGEHLVVTEPDAEGWTRVRRLERRCPEDEITEGFVPSSFIKFIS